MMKKSTDLRPNMDQNRKLKDKLKLEKSELSYADLQSELVKNVDDMTSSSGRQLKQCIGSKVDESEEIVKYMSSLPSYLESGTNFQDRALTFGVMDWGRLEKWRCTQKQLPYRSSKDLPSSSNLSSYFSTEGSSNHSTAVHSCSPALQKSNRTTLRSHFSASPQQTVTPCVKLPAGNPGKFQDLKDVPGDQVGAERNMIRQYEAFHKSQMEARLKECRDRPRMTSSSKGKMKIQEDESTKGLERVEDQYHSNYDQHCLEKDKTVVLLLPKDAPDMHPYDESLNEASCQRFTEGSHFKEIRRSDPLASKNGRVDSKMETNFIDRKSSSPNIPANPATSKNQEEEKSTIVSEGSDLKMGAVEPSKTRSVSPLRRLSISINKIGRNSISRDSLTTPQSSSKSVTSKSGSERAEASACSDNSIKENSITSNKARISPLRRFSVSSRDSSAIPQSSSKFVTSKSHLDRAEASDNIPKEIPNVSSRARSSPLRRLLDPLFPSKATNSHQSAEPSNKDSKMKVREKLDLGSCKGNSHRNEKGKSETVQALFQIAVKNGRPLFTFAVENNSDVLAATVRRLSSPMKDGSRWIYTFFTVQEVKKKNTSWLNPSNKGKGHGYVPNIVGQMKVSDASVPNREFVLFSVNLRQSDQQILDVHPRDELAAIVVKFPKKALRGDGEDQFSTTVILPGGHHGLPSKGEPSPLIERWRSGGLCDCGGWDMGCRMTVLAKQNQTSRKSNATSDQFELFSEGEFENEGPFFSMSPLKESIYSVEFNSSLSLLQAFSTCISVLECRKSCQLLSQSCDFFEEKLSEETTVALKQDEVPVRFASYPPVSPVGRV